MQADTAYTPADTVMRCCIKYSLSQTAQLSMEMMAQIHLNRS